MKSHIVSFIITFSPVFVGLFAFLLYWFIRFSIKVYKAYTYYEIFRKEKDDEIRKIKELFLTHETRIWKLENLPKDK